ncbi:high mobility group box domain-containing protein [Panaeolus papilionaceus]|nr:high mobility group box domain-containing protein [Panaeolus papilionaceus]
MPVTRNIRNIRHTPRPIQHFYSTARTSSATPPSPSSTLPLTTDPMYSPTSPAASSHSPRQRSRKTRSSGSRRSPDHIRRPRNAFIIFRSHMYNTLKSDSVKLPGDRNQNQQNELSKMAAKAWKDMDEGERAPFKAIALAEKTEHKIKYPNYVYAPSGKAGSSRSKAPKKATNPRRKKSESPSPSPSPILYDFPFHHPPRRAAAQRASEKISQLDALTPPSSVSPSSSSSNSDVHMDMEDDFIPTSEIPPLDLNATAEVCVATLLALMLDTDSVTP